MAGGWKEVVLKPLPIPSYSIILDSMIHSNSILLFYILNCRSQCFPKCPNFFLNVQPLHRFYFKTSQTIFVKNKQTKKKASPQAMAKCLDLPAHLAYIICACAKVRCAMYCYTLVVQYGLANLCTHRNTLQIMWQVMKTYVYKLIT